MNSICIVQLNPTIPVVTPDGKGEAIGWMDYGKDEDLLWIVFLQKNGECWIYPNPKIRACPNITFGRMPGISTDAVSKSIGATRTSRKEKKQRPPGVPHFPLPAHNSRNGNGRKTFSKKYVQQ